MSEDADFWDEPVERYGGWAFIVITLIRFGHFCARLRDRAGGHSQDEGADCFGAAEGGQLHNGEV